MVSQVIGPFASALLRTGCQCSKFKRPLFDVGCALLVQIQKHLGWTPVVPLQEGLALMVEDFAHRLGVPVKKNPEDTLKQLQNGTA